MAELRVRPRGPADHERSRPQIEARGRAVRRPLRRLTGCPYGIGSSAVGEVRNTGPRSTPRSTVAALAGGAGVFNPGVAGDGTDALDVVAPELRQRTEGIALLIDLKGGLTHVRAAEDVGLARRRLSRRGRFLAMALRELWQRIERL